MVASGAQDRTSRTLSPLFFRVSAARPRAGWPKRGKIRRTAIGGRIIVANPLLRWGKPYDNEMRVNIFSNCFVKTV